MTREPETKARELARGAWQSCLRALSEECAGGTALLSCSTASSASVGAARRRRYHPLRELRYDDARGELELSIGGGLPMRWFIAAPQRVFLLRRRRGWTLLVSDRSGVETLIQLSAAKHQRKGAARDLVAPRAFSGARAR